MITLLVVLSVLIPTGWAASAQGGPGAVTLMGSTVTCHNLWAHKPENSTEELVAFQSTDGRGWVYVIEGGFTLQPYDLIADYQGILGGTASTIMEGGAIIFGGTVTDSGANMIVHQRYSDGATGLTLIIMAPHAGLATVMQSVQQNCTIQGVPLLNGENVSAMAATVPGEDAPAATTSATTQPAPGTTTTNTAPTTGTTASTTTAPTANQPAASSPTFEVAGSYGLENGTQVAWSNYWSQKMDATTTFSITLAAPTGRDTFFVQDYGSHMTLEQTWSTTRDAFGSTGGTLIDEGQSPDGGYYGIWIWNVPNGPTVYVMARAMYAPGTTTPTSTGFYAEDYLIDPMLLGISQTSINGQTAWADVDGNTLKAIYAAGGPTGAPLFIATASAPPASAGSTTTTTGTAPQTTQPGTTGTVPQTGQPAPTTSTTTGTTTTTGAGQTTSPAGGQYTSPQFGYGVSWSGGWTELADVRESDTVNGIDIVGLYTATPGSGGITIAGMAPGQWTPQSSMEYWASADYLAQHQPAGTTVLLTRFDATRGGVVLIGPLSNENPEIWITVQEATFVNGQLEIDVSFAAPVSMIEAVYADAQRSVLVNGAPVVGLFTAQEILAAAP